MESCRNLHVWQDPSRVGWKSFLSQSKTYNFYLGSTSNTHFTTLILVASTWQACASLVHLLEVANRPRSITMFWASANNDGCRFGHHCCRRKSQHQLNIEVDTNILISTLIYWIWLYPSTAASKMNAQGRPLLWRCGFIKSTLLEGQAAPSPWWWCLLLITVVSRS